MKPVLRPYQVRSVDAVFEAWSRGVQRPAVVQATGTGKTVGFSVIMSRAVREERARPVLLVHRDELVDQAVAKLAQTDPGLSIGIIKAERHEVRADVCVASVQTLIRRLGTGPKGVPSDRFNLLITDECHHGAAASYISIYKHFGGLPEGNAPTRANSHRDTRMLGVTATLARADGVPLGHIWQEVVFEYGTMQGITDGYLVAPHAERAVMQDLDLSKIKSIGGDYSEGALGVALFKSGTAIAEKLIASAMDPQGNLRRTIVFAPTVACANMWADDFAAAGIRCRVVTGQTPKDIRRAAYRATERGDCDALISVMVLTEGFDLPAVEVAVIGRPTKSLTLYTQMVGRVLRPSPETGKTSALILDVCGVMDQQLTTMIDLGLPPQCDCQCGCDFQHLCPQLCMCPRSIKGKLKRPCIICQRTWITQPRAEREPCGHYKANHVVGCQHRCDGFGKPGQFEDDDPMVILDPEFQEPEEMYIDENDILTRRVELFGRDLVPSPRRAAAPRVKPKAWLVTNNGHPFLPPSSTYDYAVFVWEDTNGTFTVGELPMERGGGRPTRLATGLTFGDAVRKAEDSHPSGGWLGGGLKGIASEKQLALLERNGVPIPSNCTKQQAADLISIVLVSRRLD